MSSSRVVGEALVKGMAETFHRGLKSRSYSFNCLYMCLVACVALRERRKLILQLSNSASMCSTKAKDGVVHIIKGGRRRRFALTREADSALAVRLVDRRVLELEVRLLNRSWATWPIIRSPSPSSVTAWLRANMTVPARLRD